MVVGWLKRKDWHPSIRVPIKGLSTTFCLLDMLHTWLSHLDSQDKHIRICFLDFSKAFDRIDYNILINKLIDLGVRRSLIPWILSFLTNRRQRVLIDKSTSDWLPVTAGVPQGTKLGPILFLVMLTTWSPARLTQGCGSSLTILPFLNSSQVTQRRHPSPP